MKNKEDTTQKEIRLIEQQLKCHQEAMRIVVAYQAIKSRKCCPVCKFHKSYSGPICPTCSKYYVQHTNGQIKKIKENVK